MARQSVVLLGAGASMDAGLPNAYQLTERIYAKLADLKSDDAKLFGLIVSKLRVRHVRRGGSPYDPINVEEAYDALKRFIHRDNDLLSEFVQSWDPVYSGGSSGFDAQKFASNLASIISANRDRRLDGGLSINLNQSKIVGATEVLQRAFGGDFFRLEGASLEPFLTTLASTLEVEESRLGYIEDLLAAFDGSVSCVATLNYDRVIEQTFEKMGQKFDLGLSQWNEKRFVKFHGQSQKLIKLHGSVDWLLYNEDEIYTEPRPSALPPSRAMIFGGQNEKLVPHGPFLHLRHEFQRLLRESSSLLVIGYSFADLHLNAIIRSWVATRERARMMVINPAGFSETHPVMRYSKKQDRSNSRGTGVKLTVIAKGAAASIEDVRGFLSA